MSASYCAVSDVHTFGHITSTTDDAVISDLIARCSNTIDGFCGASFDNEAVTNELTSDAWVDRAGWLWVRSRRKAVVQSLSSVQLLDSQASIPAWVTVPLTSPTVVILGSPPMTPPLSTDSLARIWLPDSVWPGLLGPAAFGISRASFPMPKGRLYVQWSYQGGYATLPVALRSITARYVDWLYRIRQAPTGKVVSAELGVMEIPIDMPQDLKMELGLWRRVVA